MSEMMGNTRKEALKEILHRLHAGESPQRLKAAFRDAVGNVSPQEIAQLEDELVREGLPREELLGLCDLHLSLFEEALANTEVPTPPWHPVGILMAEHRELLRIAEKLNRLAQGQGSPEELAHIREHLEESERHYLREENVLFPMVEKHGGRGATEGPVERAPGDPQAQEGDPNRRKGTAPGAFRGLGGTAFLPLPQGEPHPLPDRPSGDPGGGVA